MHTRRIRISRILIPNKLSLFRKEFKGKTFKLLDVGCGNQSFRQTKYWYKNCLYFGIDKEDNSIDETDLSLMDKFCVVDLEVSNLEELEDDFFDVVIFTHVIEHLNNGLEVLSKISQKLKKGGKIYIEFPSIRSLSLPSAISTLNFCDDESHVRVYDIKEVANTLLKNNVRIIRAGCRKTLNGYITFILSIPLQLYSLLRYKKLHAKGLWDVCGFADYVYGEKK